MKQKLMLIIIICIISAFSVACADDNQAEISEQAVTGTEDIDSYITDESILEPSEILDDDLDSVYYEYEDESSDIRSWAEQFYEQREIYISWDEMRECERFDGVEVIWLTYEEYRELTELIGPSFWISDGYLRRTPIPPETTMEEMMEIAESLLEEIKNGTTQFGFGRNSMMSISGLDGNCSCCFDDEGNPLD